MKTSSTRSMLVTVGLLALTPTIAVANQPDGLRAAETRGNASHSTERSVAGGGNGGGWINNGFRWNGFRWNGFRYNGFRRNGLDAAVVAPGQPLTDGEHAALRALALEPLTAPVTDEDLR